MRKRGGVRIALSVAIALVAAAPARAASWLEMNFYLFGGPRYDAWLPACDNPLALARICPSGVNASARTSPLWPSKVFNGAPSGTLQRRTL